MVRFFRVDSNIIKGITIPSLRSPVNFGNHNGRLIELFLIGKTEQTERFYLLRAVPKKWYPIWAAAVMEICVLLTHPLFSWIGKAPCWSWKTLFESVGRMVADLRCIKVEKWLLQRHHLLCFKKFDNQAWAVMRRVCSLEIKFITSISPCYHVDIICYAFSSAQA